MKYHAHLSENEGLNSLPTNPCSLLDFDFLKLGAGQTYAANSEGREIFTVILGGKAKFVVNGVSLGVQGGRANVFGGKPVSVYIPASAAYEIKAEGMVAGFAGEVDLVNCNQGSFLVYLFLR